MSSSKLTKLHGSVLQRGGIAGKTCSTALSQPARRCKAAPHTSSASCSSISLSFPALSQRPRMIVNPWACKIWFCFYSILIEKIKACFHFNLISIGHKIKITYHNYVRVVIRIHQQRHCLPWVPLGATIKHQH